MTNLQKGILSTAAGGLCWGFSGMISQHLMTSQNMNPLLLSTFRMLGAGILLLIFLQFKKKEKLWEIWKDPSSSKRLIQFALFGLTFNSITFLATIQYTNAGTATIMQYLSAIIILVSTALYYRKMPKRNEITALVLAVTGVYLIATGGNPGELAVSPLGLVIGLISAAALALYNVLPVKILDKYGSLVITCWGMLIGGIVLAVFYQPWNHLPEITSSFIANTLIVIVLGTVLPYALYLKGIALIGPVKASMIIAVEPISATAFAAMILGTNFSAADLLGFVCILSSIFFLAERKKRRKRKREKFKEEGIYSYED